MKVLCVPDWRSGNPYQELLAQSLRCQGCEVEFSEFPPKALPLQQLLRSHPGTQVLHLHWVNEFIGPAVWSKSPLKRWFRLGLLKLDVLLARLRGKRVVWTVHNLTSHDTADPSSELRARSELATAVDHLIVHSHGALEKLRQVWGGRGLDDYRVSVIRHGNFDGCYPSDDVMVKSLRQEWAVDSETIVILFFGAVRPYKGLESLMQAFSLTTDPRLRLVIAGAPNTPQFGEQIRQFAAQDPRIVPRLSFVDPDAVAAHYKAADLVAIPLKQTLTSGSAVLAMTMGRPLIMPNSTRHLDLGDEDTGVLHYANEAQLIALLGRLRDLDLGKLGRASAGAAAAWAWSDVGWLTAQVYGARSMSGPADRAPRILR